MKFVTAVLMFTVSSAAFAQSGALLAPSALDAKTRAELSAGIAAARKADSKPFDQVAALRSKLATLDARKRGGIAPVGMMLKPLGASVFWALVEQAAFDAKPRGELNDSAWRAWRIGVLEGLSFIRDARAQPVFAAVLADANAETDITRSAAEGLGRLGTDDAARLLVKLSADARIGKTVQNAMGTCRRLTVAQTLAARAGTVDNAEEARELARALGEVGNSWAWKTPVVAKAAAEEGAVRQLAAESLVQLFARFDGPARQAASNALMVVDAPTTTTLIAAASKQATPETQAALATLSNRFAKNPTR